MVELFSLGDLYVSDFLKDGEQSRGGKMEMKMMYNELTSEVRLEKAVPGEFMYGRYWYRSAINQTMRTELKSIVDSVTSLVKLESNDLWLDIACNDGTLLGFVPNNLTRIGIDPVEDSFKKEAEKNANIIVQDFFSKNALDEKASWTKNGYLAKVVTCIAMFYDLEDPDTFLQDLHSIMHKDGLFVAQLNYTPLMLEQMAFDTICHEHIFYYTLKTMKNRLEKNGFQIVDCQLNDMYGGSFRLYVMKKEADVTKFASQPYRDVCNYRIRSTLEYELNHNYNSLEVWEEFHNKLKALKEDVKSFIKKVRAEGKTVWGYGASTKGNTLLQYFELDNTLIDGIAERSPYKYGLKTVGTNIPIYSEDDMRKAKPDYLLILPWHFIHEFCEREKEYLASGGKFIVPCPKFEVI
jgi:hypothetical protein